MSKRQLQEEGSLPRSIFSRRRRNFACEVATCVSDLTQRYTHTRRQNREGCFFCLQICSRGLLTARKALGLLSRLCLIAVDETSGHEFSGTRPAICQACTSHANPQAPPFPIIVMLSVREFLRTATEWEKDIVSIPNFTAHGCQALVLRLYIIITNHFL